jgi:hypothetical protein
MANTAKKTNQSDDAATMQVVKNEAGEQQAANTVLTLEQKIQRVEDLKMVIEKYQKLNDARRSLQSFRLSTDGINLKLNLYDKVTGQDFTTSNSSVIQVVLNDMQRMLEEKICEVERLIEF